MKLKNLIPESVSTILVGNAFRSKRDKNNIILIYGYHLGNKSEIEWVEFKLNAKNGESPILGIGVSIDSNFFPRSFTLDSNEKKFMLASLHEPDAIELLNKSGVHIPSVRSAIRLNF